jgi:hypothetical protein
LAAAAKLFLARLLKNLLAPVLTAAFSQKFKTGLIKSIFLIKSS